ncbi:MULTISPECIES: DNA repair protein RecN [Chryseobacterium]|uniref:DNA repair protein RecN n=1 Tax=Chryseobacterium camelliae TaxID=1265445 RepID=A0ABU0TLX3_9FLAO|nr:MULTISPECIES: DNA repair protein RecN [Chryseobacterium]MDQ1098054.1 DNA repair protein RecN (Recombination protein N) [Chryseobacterium camelliae]MDQ1101984.1 DNA repair protein RecN (Recombination protein N) [Chryseobacterium sp. SORGH_AS_1048]MDR6085421.1 DNA repair protein RecN (Recombination protein N) [Chryseobacterium sp. SORGH_AS_0909]MDT3408091.1 DNA repair protein RecN (Recombination protein N) [Pseudacidovorax intermedius]
MLSRIYIKNFALIDTLEVSLHNGLQVITGETGAGKSIILGALRLILGERADVKSIANTGEKSIVETEFSLDNQFKKFFIENDLDYDLQTIIRREISPTGKSRAFINDVPVTLDVLRELSSKLIDIHSQFETSNLFTSEYQFKIIDGLSENKSRIEEYQNEYSDFQSLKIQLKKYQAQLSENTKESDYKQFLLSELEDLQLDAIDYEDLQNQLSIQENAEMISENLAQVLSRFHQEEIGILSFFNEAKNKLSRISEVSHGFAELDSRLEASFVELKDIISELEDEAENIEANPDNLVQLSELNNRLNTLFIKHNAANVQELMDIRDQLAGDQKGASELEALIMDVEQNIIKKEQKLQKLAQKLSENRKKSIPVFIKKAEGLLKKLGLEKARVDIELKPAEDFNAFGKESIQLLFQANSGFPLKPIQTAISGGERSRVMLAVKKIIAESDQLPTLILDEIDTGVSGKVAEEIGNLMREMSADMQLIVISHLAQVAAKGNNNYKVVKQDVSGKTQSTIVPLDEDEKLNEIAQLLSGSRITEAALAQARELIG